MVRLLTTKDIPSAKQPKHAQSPPRLRVEASVWDGSDRREERDLDSSLDVLDSANNIEDKVAAAEKYKRKLKELKASL